MQEDLDQSDLEAQDEIDERSQTFIVKRKGYSRRKAEENALKAAKRKAGNRPYKVIENRTYAEQNYWVGVVKGEYTD